MKKLFPEPRTDDAKDLKPFDLPRELENQKFLLQALDGFVLVLSGEGEVTYVSENVNEFLGINQVCMILIH